MNRKSTLIAFAVTTALAVVYSFFMVNFLSNFSSFLLGYNYDLIGVLIGALWMSSVACVIICRKLSSPTATEQQVTSSSLYKIDHIRTNVLQPISAEGWNRQSRAAITFFTGGEVDQHPMGKFSAAPTTNSEAISITGQFSPAPAAAPSKSTDEGEKKAGAVVPAPKSDSTSGTSETPTPVNSDSVIQPKPYVVLNTSLPVPNLASAEVQATFEAKLLANIARQARKKTQPVSNQS